MLDKSLNRRTTLPDQRSAGYDSKMHFTGFGTSRNSLAGGHAIMGKRTNLTGSADLLQRLHNL